MKSAFDKWATEIEFARSMIAEAKQRAEKGRKGALPFNGTIADLPDCILLDFMATTLEGMIDLAAAMKFAEADTTEAARGPLPHG